MDLPPSRAALRCHAWAVCMAAMHAVHRCRPGNSSLSERLAERVPGFTSYSKLFSVLWPGRKGAVAQHSAHSTWCRIEAAHAQQVSPDGVAMHRHASACIGARMEQVECDRA
eukprot:jgi/Ulvmu1/6403/UM003_0031.1